MSDIVPPSENAEIKPANVRKKRTPKDSGTIAVEQISEVKKRTNRGVEYKPSPKERRQVELMVAGGLTHDDIGIALGLSRNSVEKHFKEELARGSAKVHAKLASSAIAAALKGDKTMMIFILKTKFGWRDRVEVSGPNGGPMEIGVIRRVLVDPKSKD